MSNSPSPKNLISLESVNRLCVAVALAGLVVFAVEHFGYLPKQQLLIAVLWLTAFAGGCTLVQGVAACRRWCVAEVPLRMDPTLPAVQRFARERKVRSLGDPLTGSMTTSFRAPRYRAWLLRRYALRDDG